MSSVVVTALCCFAAAGCYVQQCTLCASEIGTLPYGSTHCPVFSGFEAGKRAVRGRVFR